MQVGCAEGVGGVGGACGEGVDEGAQRFVVAGSVGGEYVAECGPDAGGLGIRAAGGQGTAAVPGSGGQGVEDGVQEGPQGGGAVGSAGERGRCACACAGRRGHRGPPGLGGVRGGAPCQYNDQTRMG